MSQSIDVGTVLGGRYKVTSSIVASREGDLVLDGVDQVLNRPVSILVAGAANSDQLAQSAREVAMGERHGAVQVLDLGISHGSTYLITNHTTAPDLLDLIMPQETPYVEPFFTDTLGSEIFGESRSHEPETYDGTIDPGRPDEYIRYEDQGSAAAPQVPGAARPGAAGAAAAAAGGAAGAAAAAKAGPGRGTGSSPATRPQPERPAQQGGPQTAGGPAAAAGGPAQGRPSGPVPPLPPTPPRSAPGAGGAQQGGPSNHTGAHPGSSRVSAWPAPRDEVAPEGNRAPTAPVSQAPGPRQGAGASRPAGVLPVGARPSSSSSADYEDYEDDGETTKPRSMPWLVGGVLAVVLIAALIFAFTTLGNLFQPQAASTASSTPRGSQSQGQNSGGPSSSPSASQAPAAPPAIDSVTRLNPGELTFADAFDSKLALTTDGNPATYWSDMEFAREDWGGFTKSVSLAVKLQAPAQVKQVTLIQSGGSGGNFSVFTSNQPSLTGATLVGTSSFTGPQVVVPVTGNPTASYVIIQINALPRLSAPKTQYPFGLRLAEVKVE